MRTTPKIPSYRLHKPTKQAMVRLDGRDCYLGRHGTPKSQAEFQRVVAEWLANRAVAPLQGFQAQDLTVAELLDAYLRHAETYYVKNGRVTSEVRAIEDSIKPLFALYGNTPANTFSPLGLKAVRHRGDTPGGAGDRLGAATSSGLRRDSPTPPGAR